MKTFSTTLRLMLASALCLSMASCVKTIIKDSTVPTPEQEPEFYEVSLGWAGEIEIDEEALVKSGEGTSLYGIEVYSAPYSGEEGEEQKNTTWTRYAYGFYGSSQNITINLLKGFKYKFAATMVEDGQNKIQSSNTTYQGNTVKYYYYPFDEPLANEFIYQPTTGFCSYFNYGQTWLKDDSYSYYYRPCGVNRYYGELVDYVPGLGNSGKAKIHMKRTNFGAKFVAEGKLATAGSLEIKMAEAKTVNIDLSAGETEFFGVYTFYYVKNAFSYAKEGEYTETVDVTFNWRQADGKIVPFGTHKITYKRNRTTVVTIKMDSTDAEDSIGLECEDVELIEDGENDVTISNGERVDADIEGNL